MVEMLAWMTVESVTVATLIRTVQVYALVIQP